MLRCSTEKKKNKRSQSTNSSVLFKMDKKQKKSVKFIGIFIFMKIWIWYFWKMIDKIINSLLPAVDNIEYLKYHKLSSIFIIEKISVDFACVW